jgi:hypothetical protein
MNRFIDKYIPTTKIWAIKRTMKQLE